MLSLGKSLEQGLGEGTKDGLMEMLSSATGHHKRVHPISPSACPSNDSSIGPSRRSVHLPRQLISTDIDLVLHDMSKIQY